MLPVGTGGSSGVEMMMPVVEKNGHGCPTSHRSLSLFLWISFSVQQIAKVSKPSHGLIFVFFAARCNTYHLQICLDVVDRQQI
jgi:hypothetical protein